MKKNKITPKEVREFRNGEISLCKNCFSMTKTILKNNELLCGKCGGYK